MGRGKQKAPGKTLAAVNSVDQKALRNTVETAVNEAVKIQDEVANFSPARSRAALEAAEAKYREALELIPGHAEAAYNLATCLSERAGAKGALGNSPAGEQLTLLREAQAVLESVVSRDTSGRGRTTALAHHVLGNVIRSQVEVQQESRSSSVVGAPADGQGLEAQHMEALRQSCRHFEASWVTHQRASNPPAGISELMVHWGDVLACMMHMVIDGDAGDGKMPSWSPTPVRVREALQLCSDACSKYTDALAMDASSGESDVDTLLLKAGTAIDFLDWALPETVESIATTNAPSSAVNGFDPEPVIATGEHAVEVVIGLEPEHLGGLLAKGDLCRLRARMTMLAGQGLEDEGRWREESLQLFSRVANTSPRDAEVLATAGEGFLEYGRRYIGLSKQLISASAQGVSCSIPPGLDVQAMRTSALSRLQEAATLLSQSAAAADASDTNSAYNAACAFGLSENEAACRGALMEYCHRIIAGASTAALKDAARRAIRDAWEDSDFDSVRGLPWFDESLRNAHSTLAV